MFFGPFQLLVAIVKEDPTHSPFVKPLDVRCTQDFSTSRSLLFLVSFFSLFFIFVAVFLVSIVACYNCRFFVFSLSFTLSSFFSLFPFLLFLYSPSPSHFLSF